MSIFCYSASLVVMTGCKKQDAQLKDRQQRDLTNNNPTAATPVLTTIQPSDIEQAAMRTLLVQASTAHEFDAQVSAAKLLGEHHCVEAVPILIDKINAIHSTGPSNIQDWEGTFPSASALVHIGDSAVPQITKRFETTNNEAEELLLLQTLRRIKGKVWVARYLNRLQVEKATSKHDLLRLIEWVNSFHE